MKILLNFAGRGRFVQSQFKNSQTGLEAGFNVVYQMNESEIDSDFYNQNKEILDQPRGAGYWLWKPYFINRILSTMNDDDILFYCDSGCTFVKDVNPLFEKIKEDKNGILAFDLSGFFIEKEFTKRDIFIQTETNTEDIRNSKHRQASFMMFRGTDFCKKVVSDYLHFCCIPNLINDTPNHDGWIEPNFKETRHDQSIWSVLTKKYGVKSLKDPSQFGLSTGESVEHEVYINHHRDSR